MHMAVSKTKVVLSAAFAVAIVEVSAEASPEAFHTKPQEDSQHHAITASFSSSVAVIESIEVSSSC
jgi:hypothetical protein